MRFKTFAIATPLSLAAWFGIYELAVATYGLVASLSFGMFLHLNQALDMSLLVR